MTKRMIALLLALVLAMTIAVPGSLAIRHDQATLTSDFSVPEDPAEGDPAPADMPAEPVPAALGSEIPAQGEGQAEPAQNQDLTEGDEPVGETPAPKPAEEPAEDIEVTSDDPAVSVYGPMPADTVLEAERLDNPFASGGVVNTLRNLFKAPAKGAAPQETNYAGLNYLGFYDLKLYENDVQVQPDGTVLVTIYGVPVPESGSIQIIHILDDVQAIRSGFEAGTVTEVTEPAFVEKFPAEAQAAWEAVGAEETVYIETMSTASGTVYVLDESTIQFYASSFSIYAIVDPDTGEEVARRTYKFLNVNGQVAENNLDEYDAYYFYDVSGNQIDNQILKNGETLETVIAPDTQFDKNFIGWYLVDYDPDTKTITNWHDAAVFETPINDITTTETVYLAALYTNGYFVSFHEYLYGVPVNGVDQYKNILTKLRVSVPSGDEGRVRVSDVTAVPLEAGKVFTGWEGRDEAGNVIPIKDSAGNSVDHLVCVDNTGNTVETWMTGITGDIDLYPTFETAHWIRFVAGDTGSGAVYVPAWYVISSTDLSSLPTTTREGFVFAGWYTEADGAGRQISDGAGTVSAENQAWLKEQLLNDDLPLYAKWTPVGTTTYTIYIWQQKVSDPKDAADADKTYDWANTIVVSNVTPDSNLPTSKATMPQNNLNPQINLRNLTYLGFKVEPRVTNNSNGKVWANGKSEVNVYFDRELLTINFNGTIYTYTPTEATTGELYGMVGGMYERITYQQNGAVWYDPDGRVYTDTRFKKTESNNPDPQQYGFENGRLYALQYSNGQWGYQTNGVLGCGGGAHTYTGPRFIEATDNSGTQYGFINGAMRELTSNTEPGWYTASGQFYDDTRYIRSTVTNPVFTGLYGSTLLSNGYSWPSDYKWTNGNSTLVFLDAFIFDGLDYAQIISPSVTKTVINLNGQALSKDAEVLFYKQVLGTTDDQLLSTDSWYLAQTVYSTRRPNEGFTFYITDKFTGFTAFAYRVDRGAFVPVGEPNDQNEYGSTSYNNRLEIYFKRNSYKLTFISDNQTIKTYDGEEKIPYEQTLTGLAPEGFVIGETKATINGVPCIFQGWYNNEAGQGNPVDFDSDTMPAADLALYAKWSPERYQIILDPDGGEINASNQSLYFKLDYGQTIGEYDCRKDYVEAEGDSGEYYYFIYDYAANQNPDTHSDNFDNNNYRKSYYLPKSEYESLSEEYKKCIDTSKTYDLRQNTYSLVGWYEVVNGQLSDTPFKFDESVTHDVTIRAVWKKLGTFNVVYNATATVDGVNVSGDLDVINDNGYSDMAVTSILTEPTAVTQGYLFEGWQIVSADGSTILDNKLYRKGDELIVDSRKCENNIMHLQAVYTKVESSDEPVSVTFIKFNGNGGTTTMTPGTNVLVETVGGNPVVTLENLQINQNLNLGTAVSFERENYTLKGWAFSADATEPVFSADEVVGVDNFNRDGEPYAGNTEANTLYAVWEENEVTIHYVIVDPNGVTYSEDCEVATLTRYSDTLKVLTGTIEGPVQAAATSTKYRFVGWFTDEACTIPADASMVDGNKLTPTKGNDAVWTETTYYAKFEYNLANLTITKTGADAADENQTFLFTVTGKEGTPTAGTRITVTIHGNGSVTISDLLIGDYTVTEVTDWSWRYDQTGMTYAAGTITNGSFTLSPDSANDIVTVTNTRSNPYWLSGDSFAVNVAGTGRKN